MSDLVLGPVIGKIGGGELPVEYLPGDDPTSMTITLPDGQWAVVIEMERFMAGRGRIYVDGVEVAASTGSGTLGSDTVNMSAMVRNKTGTVSITTTSSSVTDKRIMRIVAFPDPQQ